MYDDHPILVSQRITDLFPDKTQQTQKGSCPTKRSGDRPDQGCNNVARSRRTNCKSSAHNMTRKGSTSGYKRSSTLHGFVHCEELLLACDLTNSQGLIKSEARNDQQDGVRLLSEIFRNAPERRRECLYYLALGNYKLGNYAEARRYNDLLLDHEPANLQASSLRSLIDDKVAKEGMVGVAIVGGLAIAAGVVGGMIVRGARRR